MKRDGLIEVDLCELDLSQMELVRSRSRWFGEQDHSRRVLRGPAPSSEDAGVDHYYKVWGESYIRRDNLLTALDAGFYDRRLAPALVGLIFHGGVCRGYIMRPCAKHGRMVRPIYEALKERTAATGFFSYDFRPCHIMKHGEGFSLIDLEGVYPLHEAPHLGSYDCAFGYKDYEEFVHDCLRETDRIGSTPAHRGIAECPWSHRDASATSGGQVEVEVA